MLSRSNCVDLAKMDRSIRPLIFVWSSFRLLRFLRVEITAMKIQLVGNTQELIENGHH